MKSARSIALISIIAFMTSCGTSTTSDANKKNNSNTSSGNNTITQDNVDVVTANKADISSADKIIDVFVAAQKCIFAKMNPTEKDKIEKIHEVIETRKADKQNADAAREKLINGCNEVEITSIHAFFSCHQNQCDSSSASDVNPKANACTEPKASKSCQDAFGQFMHYFLPLPDQKPQ